MTHNLKNTTRAFGNELQNMFGFLNKQNNIKKLENKKEIDDSSKLNKKAKLIQNNNSKRNTVFLKLSRNPLQQIQNNGKKNGTTLFDIQEENITSSRLSFLTFEQNAITKGAVCQNNKKPEKIEIKDYFHSLLDDYGEDIFKHIKREEKLNVCDYSKDIFGLQDKKFFNEKNRGIIYQWLVKNNHKWKLNDDTVFMAMNIMDRYISKNKVENSEFQLVGISSYLIASKYEDIYPPYIEDLSQICNFIYTSDDIIKKEYEILSRLKFDILYNSSYKFLTFLHAIVEKENTKLLYLAQFILELSLENLEILKFSQSKRALAALLLAKKIMQIKRSWNDLRLYYDYKESEIINIQKKMIFLLSNAMKNKGKNSIFEKYESSRYKSVSFLLDNLYHTPSNKKKKNNGKDKKGCYNDENRPDNY